MAWLPFSAVRSCSFRWCTQSSGNWATISRTDMATSPGLPPARWRKNYVFIVQAAYAFSRFLVLFRLLRIAQTVLLVYDYSNAADCVGIASEVPSFSRQIQQAYTCLYAF